MTGYLRFFLAVMVMLSHLGMGVWGFNPGVVAVVIFYLLAGKVLANLYWEKLRGLREKEKIGILLKERFLRVYPVYFMTFCLTVIFLGITDFGKPLWEFKRCLWNLLVVPLNYHMFFKDELIVLRGTEPEWWLIPTGWSLGLEVQAYLGLITVFGRVWAICLSFLCSLLIYILAFLEVLNSEYFGYRLLPGVFFIFLLGAMFERKRLGIAHPKEIVLTWIALGVMFGLALIEIFYWKLKRPFIKESLLGLFLGILWFKLVINKLTSKRIRKDSNLKGDRFWGNLSYPFFLCHFLSFWILEYAGLFPREFVVKSLLAGALSFGISCVLLYLEKPFRVWRFKMVSPLR